jgi:hypothetical protein
MNRRTWVISLTAAVLGLVSLCGTAWADAVDQPPMHEGFSAPALYNLGNSYARSGNAALAELNYERALILAPMDSDIRANLRAVRASAGLPPQVGGWLSVHSRFANPNTMYWLGLIGLTLAGTGFLLGRLRSEHGTQFITVAVIGLVLTALSLGDAAAIASTLHESVVLVAAQARAAPIIGTPPLFTLPPVEVVRVREEHQGFALIRDPKGREGWVACADLAPVIPPSNTFTGART